MALVGEQGARPVSPLTLQASCLFAMGPTCVCSLEDGIGTEGLEEGPYPYPAILIPNFLPLSRALGLNHNLVTLGKFLSHPGPHLDGHSWVTLNTDLSMVALLEPDTWLPKIKTVLSRFPLDLCQSSG